MLNLKKTLSELSTFKKEIKEEPKIIIKGGSGLLYKFNYMIYSAIVGGLFIYVYVSGYGGQMPPPGSFIECISDTWEWFLGLCAGPVGIAIFNHLRGKLIKKRRSGD